MALAPAQQQYKILGESLVNVPKIFQLGINDDGLGREAVKVMKERFGDHPYLEVVAQKNQPIQGSNPYIRFALGPIARELYGNNIQLISPAISELALRNGKLPDAANTCEDLGVVVYSLNGPNEQLAKHLVEQAKERNIKVKFPMVFYGLKTVKDNRFDKPYGLRLDLDDIAVAYHVPILSKDTGSFKSNDSSLVVNGFPSKLGEGDRTLYTAQEGLRRLYRGCGLGLGAGVIDLPGGNEAGRVSFVKGASPQNLEAAVAEIEALKRIC